MRAGWLLFLFVAGNVAQAGTGSMAEGAPPELMHWGKLVGEWSTKEESLKPDGSAWVPGTGADWNFYWAYGGWGIQDDYISPPEDTALEDETTRVRGTNLRIYNRDEKKWVLTWLTTRSTKPGNFTAISNDDEIMMFDEAVNPQGFYRRIKFFNMTESTFDWHQEWSKDKENWFVVHRIHATRKR